MAVSLSLSYAPFSLCLVLDEDDDDDEDDDENVTMASVAWPCCDLSCCCWTRYALRQVFNLLNLQYGTGICGK